MKILTNAALAAFMASHLAFAENDYQSFLGQHDMVWDRIPDPWEVAPYTGNGNVGFLFYQAKAEGDITGVDLRLDLWNAELRGETTTGWETSDATDGRQRLIASIHHSFPGHNSLATVKSSLLGARKQLADGTFLKLSRAGGMLAVLALSLLAVPLPARAETARPNIILIFTDDQGYGDLGCFGGKHVDTPRIDQMAAEGMKLTSFYVAAAVCTPSRAALMTGCYPKRVGMATGSHHAVLLAGDEKGLNPQEITIAEVLKGAGYKTAMFGKWHLGDQPGFLPTKQGFDEYFGIPYSHDIHPYHPNQKKYRFPPLPLLEGEKVIEMDPDADFLTKRITQHAVEFIERNKDHPFFLYIPHPIPHRPLHVSPPFMEAVPGEITNKLKLENGRIDYQTRDKLFGHAINEIDWSVGRILDTLKAQGVDDNTLVIFTSDNGPAVGQAGPLKGRKGSTFEGGMREPTVIRWPGNIPAGKVNAQLMTSMDLLPTFAKLAGARIPTDRVIDGKDIWPVLSADAPTPHRAFFYHKGNDLVAVRSGKWKLHAKGGKPTALYDLHADIGETKNVLKGNPGIVTRLSKTMADFAKDVAENNRPAAFVEKPKPLSK